MQHSCKAALLGELSQNTKQGAAADLVAWQLAVALQALTPGAAAVPEVGAQANSKGDPAHKQ